MAGAVGLPFVDCGSQEDHTTPATLARPVAEILDSLKIGRQRWVDAHVVDYQLQSHVDCFCIYKPDDFEHQLSLLTIRGHSIVARAKGKPNTPPSPEWTIEALFAQVEEDAKTDGRVIDRLDLHPLFGFPVFYKAHEPGIPDDWLQVQVDSFAVIHRGEKK